MTNVNQVRKVRALLEDAGAVMREAIAQISGLPDTADNMRSYEMANEVERVIRSIEERVMRNNQAAFDAEKS